ncbi:hypothetical protein IAD21_04375 [Abditibacteriota bacterium]|nr:hypothetical protein IAD21_04375 [Abditibacteriota bacterium]
MPIVRRFYLPLLILLCALWSFIPIEGGDDFWAHAAIGRIVLDTGHVPKSTVFLWSADIPWVFHSYGSGVLFAFLLRLGGPALGPWICLVLNFLLAVAPLLFIWRYVKQRLGEVPLVLVCLFVPALWFSSVRWRLRPESFTVVFLTITLLFLAREKRPLWHYFAIVGMFALWPNLHAGVLAGIMMLWIGAVTDAAQKLLGRGAEVTPIADESSNPATLPAQAPTGRRIDWSLFALAAVCSILPLLCNPWGLNYRSVFAGTAATSNHISEWRPFWAFPAMNWQVAWGLCVLCVIAVAVWLSDRRRRWVIGGALLLLIGLWLQARRQMSLTSMTCMVALAQSAALLTGERVYAALRNAPHLVGSLMALFGRPRSYTPLKREDVQLDDLMRLIGQVGTLIILICACVVNIPNNGFRAVGKTAPIAMSQFLMSPWTPPGRIFNDYEYSAALEWYLDGKRPLYIDLINAYPPKIFDDWFEVAHATEKGKKILDDKKVDVIALRPIGEKNEKDPIYNLAKYLESSPQGKQKWKQIYKGVDGRVWERRQLYNAPVFFNAGRGRHQAPRPGSRTTPG